MTASARATELHARVKDLTKMGDLRKIAKEIKVDHDLALELWSLGGVMPRRLAILIFDKKQMTQELVDRLDADLQDHDYDDRTQMMDWLYANQIVKTSGGKKLIASWQDSPSALQRRIFWYQQARLRWTGQTPPDNTPALLDAIESGIRDEVPEVQWAMNFTAGWIGVFDVDHRDRCVAVGKDTGLYSHEKPRRGCTPNYLPEFIRIEVEKRA